MKEKKRSGVRKAAGTVLRNSFLILLMTAVIGLTAAVIALLTVNAAFREDIPFRMEQLTASEDTASAELDRHLMPAFIGIRAKGEQRGIAAGHNVVREVYVQFFRVLCDVLPAACEEVPSDRFAAAAGEKSFVYMKYHTPIPQQVIHSCAGGVGQSYGETVRIYEMFILPDKGFSVLVRDGNGTVYEFEGTYEPYFTVETLSEILASYQRNFADFMFADGNTGEPFFTERISTKNMLVTEKTASLIHNRESHIAAILRLMDFNPDKLYAHEESDVGYAYVESHGVLRLLDDSVEYMSASADGGISVETFTGTYGRSEYSLSDYIGTVCIIAAQIKSLSPHYVGGDAEMLLSSAETEADGTLRLQFVYTFDNLRLSECDPALTVAFRGGKMTEFRLYSVSVRNLGTRHEAVLETWYYTEAMANCPPGMKIMDIRQVYRTDFYADSIHSEWAVIYCSESEMSGRSRK